MKINQILSITILFLVLMSCEDGLNCLIPKSAQLKNKTFPVATVDSYYYADLKAEINNEPRDQDYDYFFEVEGLPEGMDYFVNFRTISIEGSPQVSGTFDFTIYLFVEGPFGNQYDGSERPICDQSTSKNYTLIVED